MTQISIAHHQEQLQAKRATLLAQIAELRGGTISRVEAAAQHLEELQDRDAQATTERENELHDLALIDAALARIQAGTYGECTDCGVDILEARLNVAPEAPRCINCQEKVEKAGRKYP
jgi:DnaK suppressor protein